MRSDLDKLIMKGPQALYDLLTPKVENQFLKHCLKPEEISGVKRNDRIKELISWFGRYFEGNANPKWAKQHSAELCYYIDTDNLREAMIGIGMIREAVERMGATIQNSEHIGPEISHEIKAICDAIYSLK